METPLPEYQRIDQRAITYWRITDPIGAVFYGIVPAAYWFLKDEFNGPMWGFILLVTITALLLIAHASIFPLIRWKRWRYRIDPSFIDLHYGILIIKKTLVPIKRVQHVATKQGPILRLFGLSTVSISTAATTHDIPALTEQEALMVRERIAELARLSDDDL